MKTRHLDNCSAPICRENKSPNTVWWAGECICASKPNTAIQDIQVKINDKFRRNKWKGKEFFTYEELEKLGNTKIQK